MSDRPFMSVIVPAHNAAGMLPRSLGGLRNSDLPRDRWELIVVDDGSTDETSLIAARYADTVVTLPGRAHGPRGPADATDECTGAPPPSR